MGLATSGDGKSPSQRNVPYAARLKLRKQSPTKLAEKEEKEVPSSDQTLPDIIPLDSNLYWNGNYQLYMELGVREILDILTIYGSVKKLKALKVFF